MNSKSLKKGGDCWFRIGNLDTVTVTTSCSRSVYRLQLSILHLIF